VTCIMYNMQYFWLSFPCFLVDILPHFVAQIVTCSISYGLWPHVVGLNEQNKYHIISYPLPPPALQLMHSSCYVTAVVRIPWRYRLCEATDSYFGTLKLNDRKSNFIYLTGTGAQNVIGAAEFIHAGRALCNVVVKIVRSTWEMKHLNHLL
jgi:hypothetical protein